MIVNKKSGILFFACIVFFACNTNNTFVDNSLKKHFETNKLSGCFAIWDNALGQFTIYNLKRFRDSAYQPASTFNIFTSLVALNKGRIFNDTVTIAWDNKNRFLPNGDTAIVWNKDMNLRQAFATDNLGFFQEMATRVGRDTMQLMLDSVKYGNHFIGNAVDSFWMNNSLTITADEQLGFIKRLFFKQLPFQSREQDIVRETMIRETTDKYILAYSTGWGKMANGNQLYWVTGWVEENKHVYFFSMNATSTDKQKNMSETCLNVLKSSLKQLGFFEGEK